MASDDGDRKLLERLVRGDNVQISWIIRLGPISAVLAGRAPSEFPKIAEMVWCACLDFVQLTGAKLGLLNGFENESSGREQLRINPVWNQVVNTKILCVLSSFLFSISHGDVLDSTQCNAGFIPGLLAEPRFLRLACDPSARLQ